MDYKELIEHLERHGLQNPSSYGHHSGLYDEAAAAITDLLARAKAAEKRLEMSHAELDAARKAQLENQSRAKVADARAEKAERERDAAVKDLKKHRKYKCDCCYYADKQVRFPCADCQSPISNYGDGWKWRGTKEE